MFVEDTNLFISNKSIEDLFNDMNKELQKWFKANKLSLNVGKTKWSLFYSTAKKKAVPSILPQLFIDNTKIEREHVTRFFSIIN